MSDQLTELLRERLADHEMDVPAGAWEHVSGHLAASASGESLREALQEKFSGHEAEVDPSAWTQISAQLGHGAAAGTAVSGGWIAAGVAAVAVTIGLLLWNPDEATPVPADPAQPITTVTEALPTVPEPRVESPVPDVTQPIAEPVPTSPASNPGPSTEVAEVQPPTTPPQASSPQPEASSPRMPEAQPPPQAPPPAQTPHPAQATGTEEPAIAQDNSAQQEPQNPVTETHVEADEPMDTAPATSGSPEAAPQEDPFHADRNTDIFIPNALTPNGDDVNDELIIVAGEHEKADVRIFSAKTGSLVYRSNDLSQAWDGRLPNGNIAEEGYYSCVVLLTDKTGQIRVKS